MGNKKAPTPIPNDAVKPEPPPAPPKPRERSALGNFMANLRSTKDHSAAAAMSDPITAAQPARNWFAERTHSTKARMIEVVAGTEEEMRQQAEVWRAEGSAGVNYWQDPKALHQPIPAARVFRHQDEPRNARVLKPSTRDAFLAQTLKRIEMDSRLPAILQCKRKQ